MQSFIIVPFLATNLSVGAVASAVGEAIAGREGVKDMAGVMAERAMYAKRIDTYFAKAGMPLEGFGMKMVIEAEKNGLDPFLIPAIAVRESSGGKFACARFPENAWGWHSCKTGLGGSTEKAIERIASHLGGNHKNTSRYYFGKDTREILQTYNPPSVVAAYADEVLSIMVRIGETEPLS